MDPGETSGGDAVVRDNEAARRYELVVDGRTAFLVYERWPGTIQLVHTEVPRELRGRGLGDVLAKAALDAASAAGEHVIATCPFVKAYIEKHPEYRPLLS
jgi:predicted GNAT family acetyltransferase